MWPPRHSKSLSFPYTTLFRSRDLEEIERELPVAVEIVRHQLVEPLPGHAARGHVVHQPGKLVGERERGGRVVGDQGGLDRKSTRLNSSHLGISYAVFCLKKKN